MGALCHALKEWAIAVQALEQGETIVLLRKGGIKEQGGTFTVDRDRVLLYPTYEHQKPDLLKSPYAQQVQIVPSGWHPSQIRIQSIAHISDIFQVTDESIVQSLLPFHLWNEQFVTERLKWKPRSPLYVLLLRVSNLAQPVNLTYKDAYGGCRSWIELDADVSIEGATAVLSDDEYAARSAEIRAIVSG